MADAEGSTSRARDILSRQFELETERGQYEAVWEQVAEFCDPDVPDVWSGRRTGGPDSQAERQERRGSRVYANTICFAVTSRSRGRSIGCGVCNCCETKLTCVTMPQLARPGCHQQQTAISVM